MKTNQTPPNPKKQEAPPSRALSVAVPVVLLVLCVVAGAVLFKVQYDRRMATQSTMPETTYGRYYAFISENEGTAFWDEVYQGARDAGETSDAFVEDFASNLAVNYSAADRVSIAVTAGVDGIIAAGSSGAELKNALAKAVTAGIPVVLVSRDIPDSGRVSFVGASQYDLGLAYGGQAVILAKTIAGRQTQNQGDNPTRQAQTPIRVCVLTNDDADESSQNLLISTIRETLNSEETGADISFSTFAISGTDVFSSQETVMEMLLNRMNENPPDILIALTEEHTNSAYQAVVDLNLVGQCNIIGYYKSDTIENAIENEVIFSCVSTDATQMGAYCTEALNEYLESGYVSEYFAVDAQVIDRESIESGGGTE